MSKTDLTDDTLASRIAAACEDRSARLVVDAHPFEPGATGASGLPLAPAGGRSRRRVALAAAAVVAVGGLVGALALTGADDGVQVIRPATTTTPAVAAHEDQTWLAPSEAPLGLDLQSISYRVQQPGAGPQIRSQLFSTADGNGRVLLVIQSAGDGGAVGESGPTVQGNATSLMPAKEGGGTTMSWSDGAAIEARWRGTDQDGAVAILNQLTWRDADHLAGFAAPADGAVTLVDESEPDQTSYAAELVYTDDAGSVGVGQGVQVQIHTSMADGSTRDVVEAEFLAGRVAGSDGSSSSYDDEFGTLRIAWPGWSAWIDANKTPVTEAQLRAVAATLTPTTEAQMRALELTTPGGELATEPPVTTTSAAPRPQDPALSLSEAPLQEPITSLEGGETTLAALADGRPMVVTLWATSCVPCIRMVQALDEIARSHPDAVVVAVAEQDAAADVEAFVAQAGVEVPILLDPDGALLAGWGRSAIPTTVVVGADGRVLGSMTGEASTVSDLEEIITQYLG